MAKLEDILQYNREMKQLLTLVWAEVPKGRRIQFLKDPLLKAALKRFHIIDE